MITLLDDNRVTTSVPSDKHIVTKNDLSGILFPIEQHDLMNAAGIHSGYKGLFRTDTNECLYAGKEYIPIDNNDIVDALESLANKGYEYSRIERYGNSKFIMEMTNFDEYHMVNNQKINPKIKVINSYDGSNSLFMAMGAYICACENGLVVGQAITYKRRHTQGILDKSLQEFFLEGYEKMYDSSMNILINKSWDNTDKMIEEKWKSLIEPFVKGKEEGVVPPIVQMLKNRFIYESNLYDNKEFSLMMASTWISTHGYKQGISFNNQKILNDQVTKIFFGDQYDI